VTEEQKAACEKLAIADMRIVSDALVFSPTPPAVVGHSCFIRGFQAAQTPEMLMLNPLVKGLVEALISNLDGLEYYANRPLLCSVAIDQLGITKEALAPFKRGGEVTETNCSWIYVNRFNDKIMLVTRNPCGCCPNDYLLEWGKLYSQKGSTTFKASELGVYLDSSGYDFIDVVQL